MLSRNSSDHLTTETHRENQFSVSGFRFQVSGFRFQVSGFRFQVSGFRFQVSGFRFQVSVENGVGGGIGFRSFCDFRLLISNFRFLIPELAIEGRLSLAYATGYECWSLAYRLVDLFVSWEWISKWVGFLLIATSWDCKNCLICV